MTRGGAALLTIACACLASRAFAAPAATATTAADATDATPQRASSRPTYVRAFATTGAGIGLRFNNPYRLEHQLGDDARGLSSTAPYFDLGVGATFGDPFGWQHGGVLRWDRSLRGVAQSVITPSYVVLRRWVAIEAWGRFGLPIVIDPDASVGAELAVGGAYFVTAGVGIGAEMIGDLFFGAATPDDKRPTYPVLSWQLGVVVEWERLP